MTTKKPKITVYISSHNYGRYLQEAIESVLRQTIDGWELLLINDNSTDNTAEVMRLYKSDKRIKVFHTAGLGLPGVANLALKHAKGEYILRLDADDVFDENILLVLGHYLDRHPDYALVFPDYFLVDDAGGLIRHESRKSLYSANHSMDVPANGACTMVRTKILRKIGGYREDLGAQDGFDLWTKVSRQYKCANVNLPLFFYRRHGANLTENAGRILNARRTIKQDACKADLDRQRPIIAVIPCRKHYDIYPDLWSKKLGGKALLDIAIETCIASKVFDKIVVTSDNTAVKAHMRRFKDKRLCFVERSKASTLNSKSVVETLEHVCKELKVGTKGITVLSYIQAPFTTTESLEEALYTLLLNNTHSAFAVEELSEVLYKRSPHGLVPITPSSGITSDFDTVYAGAPTATASRNSNFKTGSLTGSRIAHFVIPKNEAFFIRSQRDYEIAKILKKDRKRKI